MRLSVRVDPEMVTCALPIATLRVSLAPSETKLLPVPTFIALLKVKTMLELTATELAPSVGLLDNRRGP